MDAQHSTVPTAEPCPPAPSPQHQPGKAVQSEGKPSTNIQNREKPCLWSAERQNISNDTLQKRTGLAWKSNRAPIAARLLGSLLEQHLLMVMDDESFTQSHDPEVTDPRRLPQQHFPTQTNLSTISDVNESSGAGCRKAAAAQQDSAEGGAQQCHGAAPAGRSSLIPTHKQGAPEHLPPSKLQYSSK